jgi:hypothetical protein
MRGPAADECYSEKCTIVRNSEEIWLEAFSSTSADSREQYMCDIFKELLAHVELLQKEQAG